MSAVGVLAAAVMVTWAITAWLGRRERPDPSATPWDLADSARRQITLLSGQAAVAITAVVLLVTLARDEGTIFADSYDVVLTMFLVAFISFVGLGIQFALLPIEGGVEGLLLPRLLSTVAGIQHYRTLFLAWLALKPLMDTFGLVRPAALMAWLLGVAALFGWLINASYCTRVGVLRTREAFAMPAVGLVLVLLGGLVMRGSTDALGTQSVLALTLVVFMLNAVTFGIQALAPVLYRDARTTRWIERLGRPYILFDLQASVLTIAILWLALLGHP